MACKIDKDFCVNKGATFVKRFLWESDDLISIPITGISQAAPAIVTAASHGLPNNWRAAVVSAKGMTAINAREFPPQDHELQPVVRVDADNVEFSDINSADFPAYTSGGFLIYREPLNLVGVTAKMTIRTSPQVGTTLLELTSAGPGITITDSIKTIAVEFETAALTWDFGYYDLELTQATGRVVEVASGLIQIE